jgi:hypothetical protein
MSADSMASGWYYSKQGGPVGQPTGPLTWEQLYAHVQAGTLTAGDLIWHQVYPGWLPATQVPGLFAAATPPAVQAPYPAPGRAAAAYGRATRPAPAYATGRRRSWLFWAVPLIVLIVVGASLGAYFGLRGGGDASSTAGGDTAPGVTKPTAVTTTPSSGQTQASTLEIGQAATVDQGKVTVSQITVTNDLTSPEASALLYTGEAGEGQNVSKPPAAGNEFLMITFMYKKDASYQYAGGVYPADIKLVSAAGTDYRLVETTGYGGIYNSKANEVAAGVEAYVTAVYEVPAGETGLTLVYQEGYADEFRVKIR